MDFKEALSTVELVVATGEVPLLIGESGIGKTSLVKELSDINNYYLVTIDGNLLKEGEIGGLPVVEDIKVFHDGRQINRKITKYATHNKLMEIEDVLLQNYDNEVLLFIDELNRCEHAVQQELMNLILNREINGYKLSHRVKIIAAMNPSNKYDNFEDSDYQVVDMDSAQEDRFVWIAIESDLKQWIKWAMDKGNIHEHIIEFLSTFPEYLHIPNSKDSIKATPRSWERISKAYRVYEKNNMKFSKDILYNAVKGNVGVSIAQDFISYINSIKKPIIKVEDIFKEDILSFDIREKLKGENHSRLYIIAKGCLNYLQSKKYNKENISVFSEFLSYYPKDLALGIMREIKSDCSKELYNKFLEDNRFLEVFFEIYS
ncbi:AAA family ATPase [Clostridium tarantellae]|uniref:AAA domain-containing protein n=1 Tax=Clostridium tarantellae TaxID=39493 RepID=A0A6I1MVG3_9CLOT|nr:AAA family ATPase [Clostridium tarantellae]MPQ44821.1 AAA domain-containing protein [Clostridium tarantellae]